MSNQNQYTINADGTIDCNIPGYYTAYVVRDANSRRFLNRRVYSGRIRGIWGTAGEAQVFSTFNKARSCASNINTRRPMGYSAYEAEVRPVFVKRQTKRG